MRGSRIAAVVIGLPVVGLLAASIFAAPGPFYFVDAVDHYYLVHKYHGGGSLLHYTANTSATGSFYPVYAMYGGSLYAITALLGSIFGSDWFAYGVTYLVAIGLAFGGVMWLARMTHLRAEFAAAIGLVYVTSSYYLSNAYGRGAWTEFIATSALPLVLAALVSVVRSPRPSRRSIAILIVATVAWSGSHLISIVFGTLFAILGTAILALASARPHRWPHRNNVLLAGSAVVAGLAINGWFLVPQAVYANSTLVSTQVSTIYGSQLTQLQVLLAPFPSVSSVSTVPHLYTNLPTLPLLWALAVLFASGARRSAGRLVWLTTALLVGYVGLMASHRSWAVVPRFLYVIQFPYRLLTYATLIVCALVALACHAIRTLDPSTRRRWMIAGGVIVLCQVGFAAFQILQSRDTLPEMQADLRQMERDDVPPHFYFPRDYRFIPDHPIEGMSPVYATSLRSDGTASLDVVPPSGGRIAVDVPDSPFVEVRGGATRAGATADGLLVIDINDPSSNVVLARATPLPATIGRCLTLLGLAMAVVLVVFRPRRSVPSGGDL